MCDNRFQSIKFIQFSQTFQLRPFRGAQLLLHQLKCARIDTGNRHVTPRSEQIWIITVQCMKQFDIQPSIEFENALESTAQQISVQYRGEL